MYYLPNKAAIIFQLRMNYLIRVVTEVVCWVGETAGGLEIQAPKEACFAAYADIERMPQSREKDAAAAATSGQR